MEKNKNKRVQLCFDIDKSQKDYIKLNALLRGISMNKWILIALMKEIERLKQYD